MQANAKEKFLDALRQALDGGTFLKLTLGDPRGRDPQVTRVFIRRVALDGGEKLSFAYRQPTRDVTKNFDLADGARLIADLIGNEFQFALLQTTTRSLNLEFREGRRAWLREQAVKNAPPAATGESKGPEAEPGAEPLATAAAAAPVKAAAPAAPAAHDRERKRLIPQDRPWLRALEVTTADGKVARGMEAKFRQIHRFVELFSHLLADCAPLRDRALRIADMGCGKGYLTFGLCDWLRADNRRAASILGIESRAELVEQCNRIAAEAGFDELKFAAGDIASADIGALDALIALHACDTATDDAIARGIGAGAQLIVVSPCCHKQVRAQLTAPPVLAGALRHGIFQEREAEFATDALRAALLEWAGFETRVMEFISTEHTSKNLMIAALRKREPGDNAAAKRARELASFYGIREQRLAERLGFALAADGEK
jgi:hypothetical protein